MTDLLENTDPITVESITVRCTMKATVIPANPTHYDLSLDFTPWILKGNGLEFTTYVLDECALTKLITKAIEKGSPFVNFNTVAQLEQEARDAENTNTPPEEKEDSDCLEWSEEKRKAFLDENPGQ